MAARLNYKIWLTALTLAAVSCTSSLDEVKISTSDGYCITAEIGQTTKTSLDGFDIVWSQGDAIEVFGPEDLSPRYFALKSGEGSPQASFEGTSPMVSGIAKYPYNAEDRYSDGVLTTSLPSTQTYTPDSFASGASPMAASVTAGETVQFTSLCSVVKLSIVGKYKLSSIVLKANNDAIPVCGAATVAFGASGPVLSMKSSTENSSITLDCSGVTLSEGDSTLFYIAVPPQVYKGGISVTLNSPSGSLTRQTSSDLDLKASRIYTIPTFEMVLNGGLTPSASLFGEGTQASPFKISSVEDLLCLQNAMNLAGSILSATSGSSRTASKAYYTLTKDLDLSVCCGPELGSWMPIGPDSNRFCGHFDGCGHTITGLYINNEDTKGGLFGDIYTDGYLGNLDVTGDVSCYKASILCKSTYSTIENCISRGKVYSSYSAAGLIDMICGYVINCTNYANVTLEGTISNSAGGICHCFMAESDDRIINCTNYGDVRCEGGSGRAGGIAGYFQQGIYWSSIGIKAEVMNCTNYGDVYAAYLAGGISGEMYDCRLSNSANFGDVHVSNGMAGGISGQLRDPFSHSGSRITNCISTGDVSGNGTLAGICASNAQTISNCYWLYDTGVGVAKGVIGGTQSNIVSLNKSQMKGETPSSPLYGNYTDPVKALNAWAFSNATASLPYQGWQYDSGTLYPSLSGMDPQSPEGETEYLTVTPATMTLSTLSQTIECAAFSSTDVTVTDMPSWITFQETVQDGRHYTVKFTVEKNTSGSQRQGDISFSNGDGLTASVNITQRYTYYSEDYSRDGNTVTLQTHTEGGGIDLVFFGDGYTDKDIQSGTYQSDMQRGVEAFFSAEPYASFRNLFDVKYVELVSASNSFDDDSETALSCYFGQGTLVGGDDAKVREYCKSVTGKTDLADVTAIVMVNAKKYAGTCYMYYCYTGDCGLGFSVSYFGMGTTTTGQTSMEATLRHEAGGHGFGKLADEYAYYSQGTIPSSEITSYKNLQTYGWWSNTDFTPDPFSVRWTKFIQDNRYSAEEVGVYEGACTYWSGAYRPTNNSIMRYNTGKFNAPSREAIYYKIHKLAYGSSWTYDYNDFLEYDAINRTSKSQTSGSVYDPTEFTPLHPPIMVDTIP